MTLLTTLFILLFLRLGFWQCSRAHEKEQMLKQYTALIKKSPIDWSHAKGLPLQYQTIKVQGRYLPAVFFLDNQHEQHQLGYHVLSPFLMDDGRIVFVDRGWVKADASRQILPTIETPSDRQKIDGSAYYPHVASWTLGPMLEKRKDDVYVIEQIDPKKLSQILQKKVYPFIIRLDKQQAHGFVREWAVVSMPPQRHIAYAIQWFVMALVILMIFIALNLKKNV